MKENQKIIFKTFRSHTGFKFSSEHKQDSLWYVLVLDGKGTLLSFINNAENNANYLQDALRPKA